MACEFDHYDCKHINTNQCNNCFTGERYTPAKPKTGLKKTYAKESKRMGTTFEMNNHKAVQNNIQNLTTDMTPNSGAGRIKGDQQIRGLVNIMEELKTQDPNRARGHRQFTIKREWLEKLDREAPAEKMDWWYLKFAFCDTDSQHYIVFDATQMNDMIATIVHDRKKANEADAKVEVAQKKATLAEAEATRYFAEIEYLKAILKKEGIKY